MTDRAELEREVIRRARGDELYREIGADLGLTVPQVSKIATAAGISRKHQGLSGEDHPSWSGGRYTNGAGYVMAHAPDHPEADDKGYVYEHRLVASRAMGRPLPRGAQVHHVNGDRADNRPENLVVCPDDAYHRLLHQRGEALRACGHADWVRCGYCSEHGDPESSEFYTRPDGRSGFHRACDRAYKRQRRQA